MHPRFAVRCRSVFQRDLSHKLLQATHNEKLGRVASTTAPVTYILLRLIIQSNDIDYDALFSRNTIAFVVACLAIAIAIAAADVFFSILQQLSAYY